MATDSLGKHNAYLPCRQGQSHRLHGALKTNPVAYAKQYADEQKLRASQPSGPNVLARMLTETKIIARSLRDRVLQKT